MTSIINPTLYNSLPSLDDANRAREDPAVDAVISGPIRDVFLKHGAHQAFCLYLQHAHHTLGADEAIVKVKGTSHHMGHEELDNIQCFGNKVVPTTWMTTNDDLVPMELAAVPKDERIPDPGSDFASELVTVLKEHNCSGMFGVDTIASHPWCEMKIGDASVVVPNANDDAHGAEHYIPVALAFNEEKSGFIVHGRCQKTHKHSVKK